MEIKLKSGERLDDLQLKNYYLIQNPSKFCFGIDAVLLSTFAKVKAKEKALDIGTGNGIIPILLAGKTSGDHFTGLEIQVENVDLANRSVRYNQLESKIDIIHGDVKEADKLFSAASFQVITTNPPYMIGNHGIINKMDTKTIARHEILCTLDDVIKQSAKLLTFKGRFYMVHKPFRLAEIFNTMIQYGIEPKRMRLVHPYIDKEPNMVLVEGVKGSKSRITIEPPLIVYKKDGTYTEEILEWYGDMKKDRENR